MTYRILILGGTRQAREFAEIISNWPDLDITLSLAGRTSDPLAQSVPTRKGGFGGVDGLARYLASTRTDILIDATHPFAAGITHNAIAATRLAGVRYFAIHRLAWRPIAGDLWCEAVSVRKAIAMTGSDPLRIFMAVGRQELAPLLAAPQHHYVIRSIEPVKSASRTNTHVPGSGVPKYNRASEITPLLTDAALLPNASYILGRGPFRQTDETALLRHHSIDLMIAKNSGGMASYAKLSAARDLAIPIILIARPPAPDAQMVPDTKAAVDLLAHWLTSLAKRGE